MLLNAITGKGRFDGFIGGVWRNLNNDGGTPAPAYKIEGSRFEAAGGFRFAKPFHHGEGSISVIFEIIDASNAAVVVVIDARGALPSFELRGIGPFEDNSSGVRTYHLSTEQGGAEVTERQFRASQRWYPGTEWVFRAADGTTVSLIFEQISEDLLAESSAWREEDPRPSPFDDEA